MPERRADPDGIFAANLRLRRESRGWTRRRLCEESGVSPQTLKAIEDGKGCTPGVERKLALALQTVVGRLWEPLELADRTVRRPETDRWYFADVAEGERYRDRLGLTDERPRMDPEGIQDAAERARMGLGGLSCGFVRVTTAHIGGVTAISSVLEVYGMIASNVPDGRLTYFLVLQGEILFHAGEETTRLGRGDVLQIAMRSPSWMRPARPVVRGESPPQVVYVDLGREV